MPVEVVRGDVRVDGHRRAARQGRQLQLGQLVDDAVVGGQLGQALDDRDADVAPEHGRMGRIRGEDRGDQRGRRGLALRAGHTDRRGDAQPQEQVRFGDQRRHGRIARGSGRDERLERGPESWLGRRVIRVDRRRCRHELGVRPRRGRLDVRAQREPDCASFEGGDRVLELARGPAVIHGDACSGIGQEARQGDAAPGEPEHRHRNAIEQAAADRVHGQGVRVDRESAGHHGGAQRNRPGWVATNNVTPSKAARMPTIQKRIVIFSSSQPPSSK